MKPKAFSLVMIASLLASMLLIGIGTAQFNNAIDWPKIALKLPNGTQDMNVTAVSPYDIGDKFNLTVEIQNVTEMDAYGITIVWNSTYMNMTNWFLSPFFKGEMFAGRWSSAMPAFWTNDLNSQPGPWQGYLPPRIGAFADLGQTALGDQYNVTGTYEICKIEFIILAYGPHGPYIWKDPANYKPHPYATGQPYLQQEGAFPEALHLPYCNVMVAPGAALTDYNVRWSANPYFAPPTPYSGKVSSAMLWIQPPTPYAPEASKSHTPPFPFVNETVTITVTQVKAGFDGATTHDISSVTIDYDDGSATNTTAGPLPIVFYHEWDTDGSYTIKVDCYAAGMPPQLAWHNLTNPITISPVALTGIDVYEVRPDGNFGEGMGIPGRPYDPQALVTLEAYVFYGGDAVQSKLVSFEVTICHEECVLYRTQYTDENGIATIQFRIPTICGDPESLFGKWHVNVTVEIAEVKYWDWMDFDMGYILTLTDIVSVKDCADPVAWEVFKKADYVYFNVTIENIDWVAQNATIILVVYDNEDVPIGQEVIEVSVPPGVFCNPYEHTFCIGLYIPKWAFVGTGTGYINAFTAIPSECGLAWCPEDSDTFLLQAAA